MEIDWEDEFHKFLLEKGLVEPFKAAYNAYTLRVGRTSSISEFIQKQDHPHWITDHCFRWSDADRNNPSGHSSGWLGIHTEWGNVVRLKLKQRG